MLHQLVHVPINSNGCELTLHHQGYFSVHINSFQGHPLACMVDDILDLGHHSCVVHHEDQPPLAMVNKVGLP
jgi:uncharacterized protein YbgA (DUF1722 family)